MAKSNFSSAFLPGLVLGLVVGAFAGAYLSSLSLPAVKDQPRATGGKPVMQRDEGPKEEPSTTIDQGSGAAPGNTPAATPGDAPKAGNGTTPKEGEGTKKPDGVGETKAPNPEIKPPTNDPALPKQQPATDPKLSK